MILKYVLIEHNSIGMIISLYCNIILDDSQIRTRRTQGKDSIASKGMIISLYCNIIIV